MKEKAWAHPPPGLTIEKLLNRNYIRRSGTVPSAQPTAFEIDVLRPSVEWITSPELTGDMEASLLAVQRGEETMEDYMENHPANQKHGGAHSDHDQHPLP